MYLRFLLSFVVALGGCRHASKGPAPQSGVKRQPLVVAPKRPVSERPELDPVGRLRGAPRILAAAPFEPTAYDALPAALHRNGRSRDRYSRCVRETKSIGRHVARVTFASEHYRVTGVVVFPPGFDERRRLPAIVFNHGNAGEGGRITACRLRLLYNLARGGFVVFAPQYRGVAGSEGEDEYGGAEVADVVAMTELARAQSFISERIYMVGASRGGMMTFLALKRGARVDAVAVMCGLIDLAAEVGLSSRTPPPAGWGAWSSQVVTYGSGR